jgi:2-dehydropantoate 2-reductase
MRIAVFGAGGVGGYFGGRLAQAGQDVVFIARGDHLQAIQNSGLRVESVKGDFTVQVAQATDDPQEVGPVDVVLVGVKAWQVTDAARAMQPMVGAQTLVIPLQDGVEAPRQLAGVLGEEHVLGGLCRIISRIKAPGKIRHTGIDPYVAFGKMDDGPGERAEQLCRAFAGAQGVTAEIPADIQAAMWRKFLLVASWGGVGAVTRAPIGIVRSQPETRRLLQRALREIVAVAQARDVALPEEAVEETMAFLNALPAGSTTSMQRDIAAGRPSELRSQTGAVVRLGREVGQEAPLHAFIYGSLLPLERRARGEVDF